MVGLRSSGIRLVIADINGTLLTPDKIATPRAARGCSYE
jgi:hypothetical protein